MSKVVIDTFAGEVPLHRANPERLAINQAQRAANCLLTAGELEPMRGHRLVCALATPGARSVYRHGTEWLCWADVVSVVRGPIAQDQYDRIYWTGEGKPKVRGLLNGTMATLDLGLPAPVTKATATVSGSTDAEDEDEEGVATTTWTRRWFYWYEEPGKLGRLDYGGLTEEGNITLSADGTTFTLATQPPRVTASANAVFIFGFKAYNAAGKYCGTMKPYPSLERKQSSVHIDGNELTGTVTYKDGKATLVIDSEADSSRSSTTISSTATTADTDNSDYNRDRVYVYCFVSAWGEEGPPSPPSTAVACTPLTHVKLTGMDVAPSGYSNLTKKRIYRTVTDTSGTEYQFVADIAIAETEFLDEVTDVDTGEMIPSKNWHAPPAGLAFLVGTTGGFLAGAVDRTVYFSEANMPHAWPTEYAVTLDYPVVALGAAAGNSIIAITTGYPYLLTGDEPGAITVSRLPANQAGVSARAIAYGLAVHYASPDGVVETDGSSCSIITESLWTRREWQADRPAEMIFATHDKRLFMFHENGGYILETVGGAYLLTSCDTGVRGFYEDLEQDVLYFIGADNNLYAWGDGAGIIPATWKSASFMFARPQAFSVCRLLADAYPVTLNLYAAGALVHTHEVAGDTVFNLPMLRPEKTWCFEITTTAAVQHLALGRSLSEIAIIQ